MLYRPLYQFSNSSLFYLFISSFNPSIPSILSFSKTPHLHLRPLNPHPPNLIQPPISPLSRRRTTYISIAKVTLLNRVTRSLTGLCKVWLWKDNMGNSERYQQREILLDQAVAMEMSIYYLINVYSTSISSNKRLYCNFSFNHIHSSNPTLADDPWLSAGDSSHKSYRINKLPPSTR